MAAIYQGIDVSAVKKVVRNACAEIDRLRNALAKIRDTAVDETATKWARLHQIHRWADETLKERKDIFD